MVNFVNKEILDRVDRLVAYLKDSALYHRYQTIQTKLEDNAEIMDLIAQYKEIQKKLVRAEYENDQKDQVSCTIRLQELDLSLHAYPIYLDYLEVQQELDQVFQLIKQSMDDYFEQLLN